MWILMFIVCMLLPLTMLGFGYLLAFHPPKKINTMWGYKTPRSGRSQEAWDFAQVTMGKLWLVAGGASTVITLVTLLLLILLRVPNGAEMAGLWLPGIQSVVMVASIIPVEVKLKKRFG